MDGIIIPIPHMSTKTGAAPAAAEALLGASLAEVAQPDFPMRPLTPEIASGAGSLLEAAKLQNAMKSVKNQASLALSTGLLAGALLIGQPALAAKPESPYESLAATGDGIVLVEKERVRLEKSFRPLLKNNGKEAYLKLYDQLSPKAKDKVAKTYGILDEKNLDKKKIAAATSAVIESGIGVQNAKTIIAAWTEKRKDANVETYSVAQKIKAVSKLAPEILEFYDIAELEEIDRLQKEVLNAIIAQNRQDIAQNRQDIAQNRQDIARMDTVLKRL